MEMISEQLIEASRESVWLALKRHRYPAESHARL